jgi:hypothetical protein
MLGCGVILFCVNEIRKKIKKKKERKGKEGKLLDLTYYSKFWTTEIW